MATTRQENTLKKKNEKKLKHFLLILHMKKLLLDTALNSVV